MAKKLAKIQGLHNIFEPIPNFVEDIMTEGDTRNFYDSNKEIVSYPQIGSVYYVITNYYYDMTTFVSGVEDVISNNTVLFVTADATDEQYLIGGSTIKSGNKYIIAQGNVYAKVAAPSSGPVQDTWRPLLVNDTEIVDGNTAASVNLVSNSTLLTVDGTLTDNELSVVFNINVADMASAVSESLNLATVAYTGSYNDLSDIPDSPELQIGNGELTINIPDVSVYSETAQDNNVIVTPNTINSDGSFLANQSDDGKININYTGNADRADWHVDQDLRRDSINNTNAKKFIYAEPLLEYFQAASFPSANAIRPDKLDTISQDSIVFITCGTGIPLGSTTTSTDKDYFQNPEFEEGTRWIWTQGKLFSANTWMPIYTQPYEGMDIYKISPVVSNEGGRLIIRGGGNITIDNEQDGTDHIVIINGTNSSESSNTMIVGNSPIRATVSQTGIWTISLDDTNLIKWGYIS